jgi:hypothetical protein
VFGKYNPFAAISRPASIYAYGSNIARWRGQGNWLRGDNPNRPPATRGQAPRRRARGSRQPIDNRVKFVAKRVAATRPPMKFLRQTFGTIPPHSQNETRADGPLIH